jgi:hypothetical protein
MDMEAELGMGSWRMDLASSDIAYKRMREAISCLHLDPAAQEREGREMTRQDENGAEWEVVLRGTHLRDVILEGIQDVAEEKEDQVPTDPSAVEDISESSYVEDGGAFGADQRIASWARRYEKENPVVIEGDPIFEGLNSSQTKAMAMMIGRRVSLIQGVSVQDLCSFTFFPLAGQRFFFISGRAPTRKALGFEI